MALKEFTLRLSPFAKEPHPFIEINPQSNCVQQYFSLTTNQHQPVQISPETNQRTDRMTKVKEIEPNKYVSLFSSGRYMHVE